MAIHKKYNALGRGLDALIPTDEVSTGGSSSIGEIAIENIFPNPNQPRHEIDEEALKELSDSISQIGVIQPVTLRQMEDGSYQIIAGERRWRASQKAGLKTIPAYVRKASDESVMQMALIENIQREDLNPIEIALAYNNLMEGMNLTQEQLAEKVGKKRATVANFLRLLKLPAEIQLALRNKEIDQGHARALLALPDAKSRLMIFGMIRKNGSSVRDVEVMVKKVLNGDCLIGSEAPAARCKAMGGTAYDALKRHLGEIFNAKIGLTISPSGKGRISIPFDDAEDLERIARLIDKN